ncbi:hypothetical protein Hypma_005068 [Hypsizygus marmoreus]|uniref:Uncharacterized protein n=1 Tax=Hypsizygus marmoreus TaxID=39966 RepID=A0A369K7T5_HYPMA|nr:hypothetical protein Hypma_005068 [Hypsizygus marmoreus]
MLQFHCDGFSVVQCYSDSQPALIGQCIQLLDPSRCCVVLVAKLNALQLLPWWMSKAFVDHDYSILDQPNSFLDYVRHIARTGEYHVSGAIRVRPLVIAPNPVIVVSGVTPMPAASEYTSLIQARASYGSRPSHAFHHVARTPASDFPSIWKGPRQIVRHSL